MSTATSPAGAIRPALLDSRLDPTEVLFLVYVRGGRRVTTLSLTVERPYVAHRGHKFSVINDLLYVDGEQLGLGLQRIGSLQCIVVAAAHARTLTFTAHRSGDVVIGDSPRAAIHVADSPLLVLQGDSLIVDATDHLVFVNGAEVTGRRVHHFAVGTVVLTTRFLVEHRPAQIKLTSFTADVAIDHERVLVQPPVQEFPEGYPDYRRSPKLNLEPPEAEFQFQGPDKPPAPPKNRLLRTVLPPFFMIAATGGTALISGSNPAMMLGMGLATVLTTSFTVSQFISEKKQTSEAARAQEDDYTAYLVRTVAAASQAHGEEREVLRYQHPTPRELARMVDLYDPRIYERQRFNKDFLQVSLGLSDRPSVLKVTSSVNDKDADEQAREVADLAREFQTQRAVPTPLSLAGQTLGFVGPPDVGAAQLQSLLFQAAFFHSYRDVNFISLLSREAYQQTWSSWRLLPHFTLQELNMRGLVYNDRLRDVVLNSFYQLLQKRKQAVKDAGAQLPQFAPHYVFTISDDRHLAGHGINELLAEDMSALGVTVIWCSEDAKLLPETVTALIRAPHAVTGELVTDNDVYVATPFTPHAVPADLEHALRKLSNLNHLEVEKNAVPEALSLLEQYGVDTVEALRIADRWREAEPNKSIASLIGWRGKSDHVYWDLHERAHGPHALVGGTTGSGKSEFLTTYLIGLAINFSPEDVGMLIIDWKGGGIANTLDKLPHFMGAITNLDGAGTARALASIKAELNKRQREFAAYGVNSINAYMSLYKQRHQPKPDVTYPTKPLPHLVLVSDEFAELKANVPEFLDELTSVARIGRSLGVHLILATQKPSGVVNDQIEANSTSKIALKMASEQDSNELLKTTDAAHITNPGRGYLKVGQNEVYELFQSGYAGVPYDPDAVAVEHIDERIYLINDVGQYELFYDPGEEVEQGKDTSDLPTQLEAVIETIVDTFDSDEALTMPDKPWLPGLESNIVAPGTAASGLSVPLGMLDVPSRQAQENLDFDLAKAGHTAVFGSPGFGKSTVLQTLAVGLATASTPDRVQLNLIDFGNNGLLPLRDLPHVADIVTLEEAEKLGKMLERIGSLLAERKQLFRDAGVANATQYAAKTGVELPTVVNLLDGYDNLTANDRRKELIDDLLLRVLREGAALGVYLVMSASRVGGVRVNMLSNISTQLCLYLNDETELAQLMGRERLVQADIPGRGQVLVDVPTAVQYYQPAPGATSGEVLTALEARVAALDAAWTGVRPAPIPMVPRDLTPELFTSFPTVASIERAGGVPLGLSKATTEARGFLPRSQPFFLFAAKDDEQQLLFQQTLLAHAATSTSQLLIVDFDESFAEALDGVRMPSNVSYIISKSDAAQVVTAIVAYLSLNKQKAQGEPMVLVIANLPDFIATTGLKPDDFALAVKNTMKAGLDFMIFAKHDYIAKSFDPAPKLLRELRFAGLVGARAYDSPLIRSMGMSTESEPSIDEPYFVLRGGSTFEKVALPQTKEQAHG